jgi:hypothetical protein
MSAVDAIPSYLTAVAYPIIWRHIRTIFRKACLFYTTIVAASIENNFGKPKLLTEMAIADRGPYPSAEGRLA